MCHELYRKGVLLCRLHVPGDIYSPGYARKLMDVILRSSHCAFWFYTRTWRVPAISPFVRALAVMPNCRAWLSADAGYPSEIPAGCRVAWMQTTAADGKEYADLVFLDRPFRRLALPIAKVCPTETDSGRDRGDTCATCQLCWR